MTSLYKNVPVRSLLKSGEIEVRPLAVEEINYVLLLARNSGWYGNDKILNFLVEKGALYEGTIDVNVVDTFIHSSIAREVWIATLENLARHVNSLISLTNKERNENDRLNKIKVNPYKFSDIGTPGLYWSIQKDMDHIDVELFVEKMINFMIPKVNEGKKTLKGKAKSQYLQEKWSDICNWLLEKNFIDDGFAKKLPENIFSSPSQKFYVILRVSETLDWMQYFKIIYWYNKCVESLNLKSNKLGGLDVDEPTLITGFPSFVGILKHSENISINVLVGLLSDLMSKNQIKLSKHYKAIVRNFYTESMNEIASQKKSLKNKDKRDIAVDLLNAFARRINQNKQLINKLCYIYWNEFSESLHDYINKNIQKFIRENAQTNIPDCYVLVEGKCEDIFFKKAISLANDSRVNIKVINCESKNGVYRKYRDVVNNERYIGCIVTVLDADAKKEHDMIKKIKTKSILTFHYIHEKGTFEDLFPVEIHIKTLNKLWPEGEEVTSNDLAINLPIEKQLERIVWEKKKSKFDKVKYAKEISQEIKSFNKVPHIAKSIIQKALELANTNLNSKPKTYSIYSIDALAKSIEL